MCGRYTFKEDKQQLEEWFDATIKDFDKFGPNYNVAPTYNMPVVGKIGRDNVLYGLSAGG